MLAAGTVLRGEFRPTRRGARVVPSRRPASSSPPLAGAAAARDRAGRAGGAGPLPAALAGHRRAAHRDRSPGRGDRPARGHASACVRAGARRSAMPAWPATHRGCSTSSARPVRSCGSGSGRSVRTMGASLSTGRTGCRCSSTQRPARDEALPESRLAPRGDREAPGRARRLVLSRHPCSGAPRRRRARRAARSRARAARCAVGPRLGDTR